MDSLLSNAAKDLREKRSFENSKQRFRPPEEKKSRRQARTGFHRFARQDLIEIRNFIAKDNRTAARKVLAQIRAACRLLAQRPTLGHWRTDLASEPLRFWPVYSYLIIYRPESKPIEVVRVNGRGIGGSLRLD